MTLKNIKNIARRRGNWRVDDGHIRNTLNGDQEARAAWHAAFGEAVIVSAECKWGGLSVYYVGYHPAFDEVPEGAMEPEYHVNITRQQDGHTVSFLAEWRKLP